MKKLYQPLLFTGLLFLIIVANAMGQCLTPTITGNATECQFSGGFYSTQTGMTNYQWTVTGGVITSPPPNSSTISVQWNSSGNQTITVKYIDGTGCQTADGQKVVNVSARPTPTINGSSAACLNSTGNSYSTETGQTNYSWSISGGTITSGQGTNTVAVTWTSTVNPWLSVTYGAVTCPSFTGTKYVTVNSLTPTITGNSPACKDNSYAYSTESGKSAYNWSISGGTIVSGQGSNSINVLWNTLGTQTVGVTYTDPSGCIASPTANKSINVISPPSPSISGNQSVCQLGEYVYTTQSGMSNYNWTLSSTPAPPGSPGGSFPAGIIVNGSGTNSITVRWNTAGAQSVSVNYTNSGNCSASTPTVYPVTVNPVPGLLISGLDNACEGETVVYTATSGKAVYNWSLNSGGTITSGQGTNTISVIWNTYTTPGNYKIVYVNYGVVNGCQTPTTSFYLAVKPKPVIYATEPYDFCNGGTLGVNISVNTPSALQWSAADNPNVTGESLTPQTTYQINNTLVNSSAAAQDVIYTITAAANNGCAGNPRVMTIRVPPTAVITSAPSKIICSQDGVNHTITSSSTQLSYSWSAVDNPQTTGETTTPIWNYPITNTITNNSTVPQQVVYTVSPYSWGCPGTPQTFTVTVNPKPSLANKTPETICSGTTLNYPLSSAVPASFTWQTSASGYIEGESTTPQATALINNTLVNNYMNTIQMFYTVTSTATTGGCTTAEYIEVMVRAKNTIYGSDIYPCSNSNLNYNLSAERPSTFTWVAADNPNVTGESTTPQTGSVVTDAIRNFTAINQSVQYTVTATENATGCTTIRTFNAIVRPEPVITSPDVANMCTANYVNHNFTSTFPVTFFWKATSNPNVSGEGYVTENTGAVLNDVLQNETTVSQAVVYSVRPRLPMEGCFGATQTLTVNVQPYAVVTTPNKTICSGQPVDLSLASSTPGTTFTWNVFNITGSVTGTSVGDAGSGNLITHVVNNLSTTSNAVIGYRVVPTVNNCQGNISSIYVTVRVPAVATITPVSSTSFCPGGSVVLNANTGSAYQWMKDDVDIAGAISSSYTATLTGVYKVKVTNALGCSRISTGQTVTVNSNPVVTINQGSSATFCPGSSVMLSVNYESPFDYQWMRNGVNIGGNSSSINASQAGSYTVRKTHQYTYCFVVSSPINVTQSPIPVVQTGNKTICSGSSTDLTLTSDLAGATYSWYVLSKSSTLSGVTAGPTLYTTNPITHTLTNSSASIAGTVVYRVTATAGGCTGNYKDITVTVNGRVTGGEVAGNQTVCSHSNPAAFTQTTASTGPGTLSYQWYSSFDNSVYTTIAGATSTTYDPPAGIQNTTYYKRLTSATQNSLTCSAYNGTPVTVNVAPFSAGQIAGNQTICSGGNPAAFTQTQAAVGLGTLIYAWEKSTDLISFSTIGGATSATYDPPPGLTQTTHYRRVVTSSTCGSVAVGSIVTVSVVPINTTISPASASFCTGQTISVNFSVATGATYQWMKNGVTIAGATSASYLATQTGSYTVNITLSGCTQTSSPATVSQSNGTGNIRQFGDLCADGTAQLNAGWPGVGSNYAWSTGQTTQIIWVYDPGTYSVTYTSAAGCSESASILVELIPNPGPCIFARQASPGESELEDDDEHFKLYPNPASEELNITLSAAVKNPTPVALYDAYGRVVYESIFKVGEKNKTVSTTNFSNGIYMLQVLSPQGNKVTRKVVVRH